MPKLEKNKQPEKKLKPSPRAEITAHDSLSDIYERMFETDSFEVSAGFLADLEAMQKWRKESAKSNFASFYAVFENISRLNKSELLTERKEEIFDKIIEAAQERAAHFSPRVADFYLALLAEISGQPYSANFAETTKEIHELKESGDLYALVTEAATWEIKLNRIQNRIEDFLLGARALDRREGKEMEDDIRIWREQELKKLPNNPPARNNESKPGVDPMERLKEGERAPVFWTIEPGFSVTKYFKEQSFSRWDSQRNVWVEDEYTYTDATFLPLLEKEDKQKGLVNITMYTKVIAGQWISCPIPYTHGLHKIEVVGHSHTVKQDQNGDAVIFVDGEGEVEAKVVLAAKPEKRLTSDKPKKVTVPNMPSKFSEETNRKLGEVKTKKRENIARAQAISAYVRSRIQYLAPKNQEDADYYNNFYNTHPNGFAGAVDEIKKGDCDTVCWGYAAALCARLNIPVRAVKGHSVRGRDRHGNSSIHSGTGHGWIEVWDEIRSEWVLIDATPGGDPNLQPEWEGSGSPPPGYIGGDDIAQEVIGPTDEELDKLRQRLAEKTEKLSYTREERELAASAGVELKEARQIVKEINEAERTRLPNGELVVDAMARLFDAIGESRKRELPSYSGPVRRREGGENISDIVRHYIGVQAGEADPMSRERTVTEIHEEKLPNGMDVYVIGDKSGSVFSSTSKEGELLWKMQRRFEYLLFSSLYRFNRDLEKAHLLSEKALDVRTMAISFRDNNIENIDLDKSLSPRFTAEDKVKMWHSISQKGIGNGDVAAIQYLYQKIKEEKEEMARKGVEDNRLRIVVAYSDGGYVGAEAQMRAWAEEMAKLKVVVVGIGLTESAATVPVVMHNPPKSFGEIVSDMNELVAATAKHIVLQAIKLFPEKARQNAERLIEETLHKFGVV